MIDHAGYGSHIPSDTKEHKSKKQRMPDIHAETAKVLTGKESPSEEERRLAKIINFGVIYGMSSYRMKHNIKTQQKGPNNGN